VSGSGCGSITIVAMKAATSSAMGQPFEFGVMFRFLTQPLTRVNAIVTPDPA
jgi:hypothetical protein